jgi:hypothetical protein
LQAWARYLICGVIGVAAGSAYAISQVRGGLTNATIRNGPWTTGKTFGTKGADALTRAKVALGGLLALPAKEAMYFTASTDSLGKPLDGQCRYSIKGGEIEARWWSITLYDPKGYLVANRQNKYSVGSGSILMNEAKPASWVAFVGPQASGDLSNFIPTGAGKNFDLTLRVYHPRGALFATPASVALPTITREGCAS